MKYGIWVDEALWYNKENLICGLITSDSLKVNKFYEVTE